MNGHLYNFRPQTKFAKAMFSQVSVCPQGGYLPHTPGQTPSPGQTPRPWADTPLGRHPLTLVRHPLPLGRHPPTQSMLGYTHPLPSTCWGMVRKWLVRIPLECIIKNAFQWDADCPLLLQWLLGGVVSAQGGEVSAQEGLPRVGYVSQHALGKCGCLPQCILGYTPHFGQNSRHTLVKTLPFHNYVADGNKTCNHTSVHSDKCRGLINVSCLVTTFYDFSTTECLIIVSLVMG